jgi:DNA mismatch repair protein MutS
MFCIKNRYIFFIISVSLITSIFDIYSATNTIYSTIRPLNLASLKWEDEEWPNEPFNAYLYRCLKYQMFPQEIKKRRIVFNLFDKLSSATSPVHNALYDVVTTKDLHLLTSKDKGESYVCAIVDRTKTQLGKVFLYGLISSPITDIDALRARQNIIKTIRNTNLYDQLNTIYEKLALSENMALSLWSQDGFLNPTKRNYFAVPFMKNINETLNSSAWALEIKSLLDHHTRAMFLVTGVLAAIMLPIHGLGVAINIPLPATFKKIAERLQAAGGRLFALVSGFSDHPVVTTSTTIAAGAQCALFCKEEYEWARDNLVLDLCMQKKMILIADFFKAVIALFDSIQDHPDLIKICPAAAYMHRFMHNNNKQVEEFFQLCSSSTLQAEPSLCSFQGRVLAAFKLAYDLKETIEPLLMAIGELDAYCSCARLYNEFNDKRVKFCFALYKHAAQPSIAMQAFWNPFISADVVISNDLNLNGGPDRRNMIITGPNAGGKSTILTALPINLVLAQSIGLAAAEQVEITPFHAIATYLNNIDAVTSGNSLFKAQVLRAQEMVRLVEKTPENLFSFVALDELFNGTSAQESMAAAYSVIKHIGNYHNNITVVATNFPLLTHLEEKSDDFANYKVCVNLDMQGTISYPFKIEKGISNQHSALDILQQEGFDCSIITQAADILAEVNVYI